MNFEVIGADEDEAEAEADDQETIPDIQTYQALQDADTIPNPPSPPGAPNLDRYSRVFRELHQASFGMRRLNVDAGL
jgi:hypothetical protein